MEGLCPNGGVGPSFGYGTVVSDRLFSSGLLTLWERLSEEGVWVGRKISSVDSSFQGKHQFVVDITPPQTTRHPRSNLSEHKKKEDEHWCSAGLRPQSVRINSW